MALTTPDNIWTPNASDNYALTTDLATTASSIQSALTQKANYGTGTTAQMNAALSRFPNGAVWYNTTTSSEWRRVSGAWVNQDTGWVTLDLLNGWATSSSRTPRIRRIGDVVTISGQVEKSTGSTMLIASIPSDMTAPNTVLHPNYTGNGFLTFVGGSGNINASALGTFTLDRTWMVG